MAHFLTNRCHTRTTVVLPAGRTAAVGNRIEVEGNFDAGIQTLYGVRFENDDDDD